MRSRIINLSLLFFLLSFIYADCDPGYLEINEYPNSVTVLGSLGNCFSEQDMNALGDIIIENNLELTNGLYLGRQTWFDGRIRVLIAGDTYLGGNVSLETIPDSIGDLDDIRSLYLDWNQLQTVPETMSQLTSLIDLHMSNNQLTSVFSDFSGMTNMRILDVGYNRISSLPESVSNLVSLEYLWLFENKLTAIPEGICDLNLNWQGIDNAFLPYFASGGNRLCFSVPDCVENAAYFEYGLDQDYYLFIIEMPQNCEDLNNDMQWDVLDVVMMISYILDEQEFTPEQVELSDFNVDGTVDILDLVLLVTLILSV